MKTMLVMVLVYSCTIFSAQLFPYGAKIQNKKTKEMIIAHCHKRFDDKPTGKVLCLDMRMHLVDKNFEEIRELTKIKLHNSTRSSDLPGTDEYIRTPEDFKQLMVARMIAKNFWGTILGNKITELDELLKELISPRDTDKPITNIFFNYLINAPKIIAIYPYDMALKGIHYVYSRFLFPKKIKIQTQKFYQSIQHSMTNDNEKFLRIKNKDFIFALEVLEN